MEEGEGGALYGIAFADLFAAPSQFLGNKLAHGKQLKADLGVNCCAQCRKLQRAALARR